MSIFVPKKVNVGFQNRKDTYKCKKLADQVADLLGVL